MLEQPASKADLLHHIRSERASLEAAIELLGASNLTQPVLDGGWSVKDVLAHITIWERRIVRAIGDGQRGETPAWPEPGWSIEQLDEINQLDFARDKDRSLDDVLGESLSSYQAALACAESLDEGELLRPPAWRPNVTLIQMISANTWDHYREHIDQIEAWHAGQGA